MKIIGTPVNLAQLAALPTPTHTASWRPLGFHAVVTFLLTLVERSGLVVASLEMGLNKTSKRFIAILTFEGGDGVIVPAIMLRGCWDKAWAWNLIAGGNFIVCMNGIFDGEGVHVLRKNTLNVWSDFRVLMTDAVADILPSYERVVLAANTLRAVPCSERRGAALIGVARYEGLLTSTQETIVMNDWRTARHAEFSERSLFSLYNCGTEGLKAGAFDNAGERHAEWHGYMLDFARTEGERLNARPALTTGAPEVVTPDMIIPASARAALAGLPRAN